MVPSQRINKLGTRVDTADITSESETNIIMNVDEKQRIQNFGPEFGDEQANENTMIDIGDFFLHGGNAGGGWGGGGGKLQALPVYIFPPRRGGAGGRRRQTPSTAGLHLSSKEGRGGGGRRQTPSTAGLHLSSKEGGGGGGGGKLQALPVYIFPPRRGGGGGGRRRQTQALPVYIFPPKGKLPESEAWSVGAVLEYHSNHIYPIQRERVGGGTNQRTEAQNCDFLRVAFNTAPPHQGGGC